jgi:tetratricopeptide (TPR) repeat protein
LERIERGDGLLPVPHAAHLAKLRTEIAALPPQFAGIKLGDPFGEWINIAALAEHLGEPDLAHLILSLMLELLSRGSRRARSLRGNVDVERVALCWARRGRLARIAGALDDAAECYEHAVRISRKQPWQDARPHAEMGLAVLAIARGNLPEGERRSRAVLAHRPRALALYRVQAHQVLSFTERRRGRLLDALLHGWEGYDLLDRDDLRRHELVASMAEIAMDCGDLDAAARGFDSVIAAAVPLRIRVPALVGAIEVALHRLSHSTSRARPGREALAAELVKLLSQPLAPGDRVLALVALIEWALSTNGLDQASAWLLEASALATTHQFHEKQFRLGTLRERLDAQRDARSPAQAVSWSSQIRRGEGSSAGSPDFNSTRDARHPALARLSALRIPRASHVR